MALTSRISAVTVFLDRAKVTRTGVTKLPAGESLLTIENIPTTVIPDSVRVKGTGAGVRILGIDVPLVQYAQTPDGNVADLQNQLDQFELRQKELQDEQAAHEQRLKMTTAMRVAASTDLVKGLAWGRSNIEAMEALTAYTNREDEAARAALRDLGFRTKSLNKELEALRARLKQLQQPASVQRRSIQVAVEAAAADTDFTLEASYTCTGATWNPLYDIRLSGHKVHVTYLAYLTQNTGEDWQDVELSLSTARPAVTTTIPELSPWFLNVYVPPPSPMAVGSGVVRSAPGEFTAMFSAPAAPAAAAAPAPMPPPPQATPMQAEVEQNGASATFRIPRRTSIPSDRTPHRAQIAEFELPATLDYVTAPKIAEQAYLRATVRNDSPFVLLPGKANLFHGEEFVGTTNIEDTASREFEIQMGVDERVSVTRELVLREVAKAFIGNTRRITYSYRIKIAHRLETASKILVIDQLPHSRHEEIKVKLNDAVPKPSEQTDLSELRWKCNLEPDRDLTLSFGFTVEYPRQLTVRGLKD